MTKWETFWKKFDQARVIPRLVLGWYLWHAMRVSEWFLALKEPSLAQAGYPSVIWGMMPLLLSFYMQHGVDWTKKE